MSPTPDDMTLAALAAAAGVPAIGEADLPRLGAGVRQVREDARALEALDLEGVEPEARPEVDPQ